METSNGSELRNLTDMICTELIQNVQLTHLYCCKNMYAYIYIFVILKLNLYSKINKNNNIIIILIKIILIIIIIITRGTCSKSDREFGRIIWW